MDQLQVTQTTRPLPIAIFTGFCLLMLGLTLFSCSGQETPLSEGASPDMIATHPFEHYDGWDTGLHVRFSDTVPLQNIQLDNDAVRLQFSPLSAETLNNQPFSPSEEVIVNLHIDTVFGFPGLEPVSPVRFLGRMLEQSSDSFFFAADSLKLIAPPQPLEIHGDHTFAFMHALETYEGVTFETYYAFGIVDTKTVIINGHAPREQSALLQTTVQDIIASLEPTDYTGWHMMLPDGENFSFALPDGWSAEPLAGFGIDEYAYTLTDGSTTFEIVPAPQDIETAIAEAGEGWTQLESAEQLPYHFTDPIALGSFSNDNLVRIVGATRPGGSRTWTLTVEGASEDIVALRSTFENILRSIRPRTVPPLFHPDVHIDRPADTELVGRDFYFLGGYWPIANYVSADPDSVRTIRFDGDTMTFSAETACGTITGTFTNPNQYLLDLTVTESSPRCDGVLNANLNGYITYLITDGALYLHNTNNSLLLFGDVPAETSFPHRADEFAALAPFLLDAYSSRNPILDIQSHQHEGVDTQNAYQITHFGQTFELYVLDEAAASIGFDASDLDLYRNNRYIITWESDPNAVAVQQLIDTLFEPID